MLKKFFNQLLGRDKQEDSYQTLFDKIPTDLLWAVLSRQVALATKEECTLMPMPSMVEGSKYYLIQEWKELYQGFSISEGEVMVTVETDKATFELDSSASGYVYPLIPKGVKVVADTCIAIISPQKIDFEELAEELRKSHIP